MQTSNFSGFVVSAFLLLSVVGCRTGEVKSEPAPMNFGVYVKFFDVKQADTGPLATAFENQAQVYQICSAAGQEFNFRFSFEVAKSGQLVKPKLLSHTPDSQGFVECFLRHFSSLRLPASRMSYRGEAQLGAYLGPNPQWLTGYGQKILEK